MTTLNQYCNDAIVALAELIKLNPEQWGGDDRDLIKQLNRSRELDPTGITTFLILQGRLDAHLQDEKFSAKDILKNRAAFEQRVKYLSEVSAIIEHPDTIGPREEFKDSIRARARSMGVDPLTALEAVLDDPSALGYLRWSALKSAKDLEVFHFTYGDKDPRPLAINGTVFEFWNMNSLLRLLQAQDAPGITLCLIRDPAETLASFFVFAVKSGDHIVVWTDRDKGPHPQHYQMSRSRGSHRFEHRRVAHYFPYDLLEIKHDGKRWNPIDRTSLVPLQAKLIPRQKLAELPPSEFIWATLTMQHIADTFPTKHRKRPQLGYTAEMINTPHTLVSPKSALARKGYQPLSLTPLALEDVTKEALEEQLDRTATGRNEWLVERHKDMVPVEVLNVVGGEHTAAQLGKKYHKLLAPNNREKGPFEKALPKLVVATLSPTLFGHTEEIVADRLWIARRNMAEVINEQAEAEWHREEEAVHRWVSERVQARKGAFILAAARGTWPTPMTIYNGLRDWSDRKDVLDKDLINGQFFPTSKDEVDKYGGYGERYGTCAIGTYEFKAPLRWRCAVNPRAAARVFTTFYPRCPDSLAVMLGVRVSDLPIWLQHWYATQPYYGNSILDRLDPVDWAIRNQWIEHFRPRVWLALSPRAFQAVRKQLDLPPHDLTEKE